MSAKKKLIKYFEENVGVIIDRKTLSKIAGVVDWTRVIRTIRADDGYDIESVSNGYRLNSLKTTETGKKREAINKKLRYAVLTRDESTCQRCGRRSGNGVKLHVDHKIPVDMSGKSTLDNLWTLCADCNHGKKKNLFSDEDADKMAAVFSKKSLAEVD